MEFAVVMFPKLRLFTFFTNFQNLVFDIDGVVAPLSITFEGQFTILDWFGFWLRVLILNRVPGGGVAFGLEELVLGFDNDINVRDSFDVNLTICSVFIWITLLT